MDRDAIAAELLEIEALFQDERLEGRRIAVPSTARSKRFVTS